MNKHEFDSQSPVIRQETYDVARFLDVSGLGDRRIVRFSKEISWVREATAQCRIVLGDRVEREASYCDVGRHMSSLLSAVEDAAARARAMGLTGAPGPVCLEAVLLVHDIPCIPSDTPPWIRGPHARRWIECPHDWLLGSDEELEHWRRTPFGEREHLPPICLRRTNVLEESIWTSDDLMLPTGTLETTLGRRLAPAYRNMRPRQGDASLGEMVQAIVSRALATDAEPA